MSFPDYYSLLSISSTASSDEIRTAYKKESLRSIRDHGPAARTHLLSQLDVIPTDSSTHRLRKRRRQQRNSRCVAGLFSCTTPLIAAPQAVADAYYVLSDPVRRREYDALRSSRRPQEQTADPSASSSFFANFASMFGGAAPGGASTANTSSNQRPDAEDVFGDVFEEVRRFV